ncbi:MAG: DNRLRE domain-containing protein [Gammaproteobacteria bacterium]
MKRSSNPQQGYILVSIILTIVLISSVAFILNREGTINVSLVSGDIEHDQLQYVAEAALNHAIWALQSQNCNNVTSLPNTAFGSDRYSAVVTDLGGSNYSIIATGTLENGSSKTFNYENIAVSCGKCPVTTVLQPSASGKDAYIRANKPTTNYGGSDKIKLEQDKRHGLIEFDLSSIPTDASVSSATLGLYLEKEPNNPQMVDVHAIQTSWLENNVTWQTPWTSNGGDYTNTVIDTQTVSVVNFYQWNVLNTVIGWLATPSTNHGLLLKTHGNDKAEFTSSESGPTSNLPKLEITYLDTCSGGNTGDQPSGSSTVTLTPTLDAYIKRDDANKNYGNDDKLKIGKRRSGGDRYRTALYFDLNPVPHASLINSASLRLFLKKIKNGNNVDINIDIHPVITSMWTEGTGQNDGITWSTYDGNNNWNNSGGDFDSKVSTLVIPNGALPQPDPWIDSSLTPLIQEWVDGLRPNLGLILVSNVSGDEQVDLNSRESGNSGQLPELVITYTPP